MGSPERQPPSAELAEFVSALAFENLPDPAVRTAERAIADTVGVALAGASAPAGGIAADALDHDTDGGPATLLGRTRSATETDAAFLNGTAAHALDYDDVSTGMDGHPSPPVVPAMLAVAETVGVSGRDLLTAYVAGFEAQCAVARPNLRGRTGTGLHPRGWHPTAIFGTIGAAAAVASILELDEVETRHALNLAASMPAGLKVNFGSLAKPMHAGRAAAAGVRAGRLAAAGFDANPSALGTGFFPVYAGIEDVAAAERVALGQDWSILEEGIDVKFYPACHALHTSIHAVSTLIDEHEIEPGEIERIHVDANEHMVDLLVHDDPATEAEAKFSIPYAVAAAAVFESVGIGTFEPQTITKPAVQRIRERVDYALDPTLSGKRDARVRIETAAGDTWTRQEDVPPGAHGTAVHEDRLREKFLECAARTIDAEPAEAAFDELLELRRVTAVSTVIEQLTAAT